MRLPGLFRFVALALIPVCLSAGPTSPRFERLGVDQGLSQGTVQCIAQDAAGFLWFGTADGLNRYDGRGFQVIRPDPFDSTSLRSGIILSLAPDTGGVVWIGTVEGPGRYDPAASRATRLPTADPLDHAPVLSLKRDRQGVLWMGTSMRGLFALRTASGEPLDLRSVPALRTVADSIESVFAIFEDRPGGLWLGTNLGVLRLSPDRNALRRITIGGAGSGPPVQAFTEDGIGRIWMALQSGGIARLEPDAPAAEIFPPAGARTAFALAADRTDGIWAATESGLLRVNGSGEVRLYEKDPADPWSLQDNITLSLQVDRSGILWAGTYAGGVAKYNPRQERFGRTTAAGGPPHSMSNAVVWAIHADTDGTLWIGTEGGLERQDAATGAWTAFTGRGDARSGPPQGAVTAIARDGRGRLWVGTRGGGAAVRDERTGSFTVHRHTPADSLSITHDIITALARDSKGQLWVGTQEGLSVLDAAAGGPDRFRRFGGAERRDLTDAWITGILEDRAGDVWIATVNRGLYRRPGGTETLERFTSVSGDTGSLPGNVVIAVAQDAAGRHWVGTANGLCLFDPDTRSFRTFTEREGLANAFVNAILPDDAGNIWVSTNRGVSRCSLAGANLRVTNFELRDGLQASEFNAGAAFRSAAGELSFGGSAGFNRFLPERITSNPSPPPVVLLGFAKMGAPVPLDGGFAQAAPLELAYTEYAFAFDFAALDFAAPDRNRYRYRMEGLDPDWVDGGNRGFASYTHLDPGTYTFRVIAANSDGTWNEQGAAVTLIVHPPFWSTWWFRLLAGLVLAGLLWAAYRVRVRRLLALERLRTSIASDLHDEVGSALTRIAVHSEIIATTKDPGRVSASAGMIGAMSREIISTLSDIVWAIDARRDTAEDLAARLKTYALEVLGPQDIALEFTVEGFAPHEGLPPALRQNLYLIGKEAVNNSAKYSGADRVRVALQKTGAEILLRVADTGRGLPGEPRRDGHGLRNMEMRARRIGGVFSLAGPPGVVITVRAPMHMVWNPLRRTRTLRNP